MAKNKNKICCEQHGEGRQRFFQLVSKTEEEKTDLEEGLDVEIGHSEETFRNTECVGGRIVLNLSFWYQSYFLYYLFYNRQTRPKYLQIVGQ